MNRDILFEAPYEPLQVDSVAVDPGQSRASPPVVGPRWGADEEAAFKGEESEACGRYGCS